MRYSLKAPYSYTGNILGIKFEQGEATINERDTRELDRTLPQLLLSLKEHGVEIEYPCPDCDRVFTSKWGLMGHSKTHKEK